MKLKRYLCVPFCSALALLAIAGCADDDLTTGGSEVPQGNGIVFGASAGYAGAVTRVVYGDYTTGEGGNYASQAINWVDDDKVSIYSPTSPNKMQVDYDIAHIGENTIGNDQSVAYLAAIDGQDGLQWDRSTGTQSFYAVYPSKASMSNAAIQNIVSFENGKLTGYVPVNQQHTIASGGSTGWTATPVMDYLYMAAIQKDFTVPDADAENQGVSLDFVPLTTTLEITIHGTSESANTRIVQMNVFAEDNDNIAGSFTCDLVNGQVDSEGYPVCEYQSSSTVRNMVTVSTYTNDNEPLQLQEGQSITFNVFLLPHQDLTNLSLRIVGLNTTGKTMELAYNGSPITLSPHKKTRIEVNAPNFKDSDNVNNWMSVIEDNVYVSQLSIPGTANSFSYNYSGTDEHLYKTQEAFFEEQWNAGIRCFELKCPNSNDNDLSNSTLQCNGQDLGLTFGAAVDMIWGKVQNSGEFAMIIPFFENTNGRGANVTDFANDLNQFFTNHHTTYKYVTYGRNLTLEEARGSLMFVARITSEEDDDAIRNAIPDPVQGVFVENWGSLKDNWERRGYDVDNWAVADDYSALQGTNTMERYLIHRSEGANANWTPTTIPTKGTVNFGHATTREDGSEGTAYIQDWSRVVKTGEARTILLYRENRAFVDDYYYYAYWPASYDEKFGDVKNTFLEAIADNGSGDLGSTFYINSLDGYYIDWTVENSYKPYVEGFGEDWTIVGGGHNQFTLNGGGCGDIASFAEDINNDFYNYILDYGADNIYGSMNIVLMDMVYRGNGGTYLPSVIINNNFRFPLLTADESTTYNATYSNGGNAISNN